MKSTPLIGKLLFALVGRARNYAAMMVFLGRALLRSRELGVVQDNTGQIRKGDILLFCTLRNEAFRIPHFLEHYRRLGVGHFVFVDNGSEDCFQELVRNEVDISVWHSTASYKRANFGMHWLNYLLRRYGSGHWCVVCDPDEYLVFPYSDQRNLYELCGYLDDERRQSFFCLLLDMYSDRAVNDTHYDADRSPLAVCPYFDASGYVQRINTRVFNVWVQGGVRRRVIFRDNPSAAPALNKTPLVKWKWNYSYISSMHALVPRHLNVPHHGSYLCPTGCLLHFKFFSVLQEKAAEEQVRKEHFMDSLEYSHYNSHTSTDYQPMTYEGSVRYEGWKQLVRLGLMNIGKWF